MKKILWFISIMFLLCGALTARAEEEFYIVTNGPVAVGGGMIRHYMVKNGNRRAVRYSYGGVDEDGILVKKKTRCPRTGLSRKELLRIPFVRPFHRKRAWLEVGTHTVLLTVNGYGRVLVKEVRDKKIIKGGPNANVR
ncbi:MAG: hypothetical protein GF409_07160 [Candidatus Omnitrophica bacterium]|nr:hypothetical protein [Candidatus Omnitrophota bacterium]